MASAASQRGTPRRSSTAYSSTAIASPTTCWRAAISDGLAISSTGLIRIWYPGGSLPGYAPNRYFVESM